MGEKRAYTWFWCGNLRERDHLGDPDTDGRLILSWIFRKWYVGVWIRSSWLGIGTVGDICEYCKKSSGTIKCGEFLD